MPMARSASRPPETHEQIAAAARVRKRYHIIREHREGFPPWRRFLYVDDGVSCQLLDGITHEISVRPDGTVLGEPTDDDWEVA